LWSIHFIEQEAMMSNLKQTPWRVFVSYSHDDLDKAEAVLDHLRSIGMEPMSDHVIPGGTRFSEEIRWQIACSHVFVSLLTTQSQRSTWVISELGYALGVGTAVLPLSLEELPEGLAHELHAVKIKPDLSDLSAHLTRDGIDNLVFRARQEARATFECADSLLDRTALLVREAQRLRHFPRAGCLRVRQRMAFSSFSIPDEPPGSERWTLRNGPRSRTEQECQLLRQERKVMELHARGGGCDLILDPYVPVQDQNHDKYAIRLKHSPEMTLVRLRILGEFIRSFPGDDLRIAFNRGHIANSLVMLGDWLAAEAVVPHYKGGYRQTIMTRHGPTLQSRIEVFEEELNDCLKVAGTDPNDSREAALEEIERLVQEIEAAGTA